MLIVLAMFTLNFFHPGMLLPRQIRKPAGISPSTEALAMNGMPYKGLESGTSVDQLGQATYGG